MAAYAPTDNQLAQSNASDLQQPRNDLQPVTNNPQQGGETSGSPNLSQEQLTDSQLRVGDSSTTVQNTTTNASYGTEPNYPSLWLWFFLLVIGVVALVMLMWRKRPESKDESELTQAVAAVVESKQTDAGSTKDKPKKKPKSARKPKSSAKRKARK